MVSSNKILTVSYGTFSCTAEGFDDPLAVVKETTHFFRGVVGEDRFFGAEPPQFDSELAGELMRQQISADTTDGKLTLRPAVSAGAASAGAMSAALTAGPARAATLPDDDTIEAAAAEAEAIAQAEADAADAQAAEAIAQMVTTDDDSDETGALDADTAPQDITQLAADSAAEMTAATVSADAPAPAVSKTVTQAQTVPASDSASDLGLDPMLLAGMAADSAADLTEDTAPEAGTDFDLDALLPNADAEPVEVASSAPAPRSADPASVAAKLDRIRAVVADAPKAMAEPEEAEDILASVDADEEDDASLDSILDSLQAETDSDDTLDFDDELAEIEDSAADSIASLMQSEVAALDEGEDPVEAEDDNAFADWDSAEEDDEEDAAADLPPTPAAADLDWDDAEDEDDTEELAELPPQAVQPTPPPPPATRPAPLRARVIKVKRAEFDKVVAAGKLEEVEDEPKVAAKPVAPVKAAPVSSLSLDEEEELARELAAVKAELAGDFNEDDWDDEDDQAWDDAQETAEAAAPDTPQPATTAAWDTEDEDEDWDDTPEPAERAALDASWDDDDDWDDDEDDWDDAAEAPSPLRLDNPVAQPSSDWDSAPEPAAAQAQADESISASVEDNIRSAVEGVRKAVKMSSPARAMLTETKVEDNDTSRILDQTNEELEEPEGNRRRSAIAHLRAAVAATKADKLLGRKSDAQEEIEPYREDLATVVRPRRPQSDGPRTERPSEAAAPARPAPLKLVAEQRVAETSAQPAQPVRPRRVNRDVNAAPTSRDIAAPEPESPTDGSDFAAYAENVGANGLYELLEAAAAYMSFVEGRDQFSRPQLMTTVRQAEDRESSREDRLRSFGKLLREGKIEKTTGGRFTASDRISFKPDRAAG